MDADDLKYYFEERAAVYEFDGKLSRSVSESRAKAETETKRRTDSADSANADQAAGEPESGTSVPPAVARAD